MRVLITAGSTQVPVDDVRVLTNVFKGRTGMMLATEFVNMGAEVTLLTSGHYEGWDEAYIDIIPYRTFDDLLINMRMLLDPRYKEHKREPYDVVIHSAAVSDYRINNVELHNGPKKQVARKHGKISSKQEWIKLVLVPTVKIVDKIRKPWNFRGKLVKFKLEVGKPDKELIKIAHKSMLHSKADVMVANCLEWAHLGAYVITPDNPEGDWVYKYDLSLELMRRVQ
ncbi:phosphopantothenoylcysteine decarboxylase [Patescibacteria group bacterium]